MDMASLYYPGHIQVLNFMASGCIWYQFIVMTKDVTKQSELLKLA